MYMNEMKTLYDTIKVNFSSTFPLPETYYIRIIHIRTKHIQHIIINKKQLFYVPTRKKVVFTCYI